MHTVCNSALSSTKWGPELLAFSSNLPSQMSENMMVAKEICHVDALLENYFCLLSFSWSLNYERKYVKLCNNSKPDTNGSTG